MNRHRRPGRHARENSTDLELGTVRFCPRCDEEWPFDNEFWRVSARRDRPGQAITCRACVREDRRVCADRRKRRAA